MSAPEYATGVPDSTLEGESPTDESGHAKQAEAETWSILIEVESQEAETLI